MDKVCLVHRLGLVPYQQAWDLQNKLAAEIARGERHPTLLLLQHPHTYTFGRGGHIENLLWDQAELARRGIELHWVDRGGDVTYHGPGQLVGYPLLPLVAPGQDIDVEGESSHLPQMDYVGYLRKLESMLVHALVELGVSGRQLPGLTGVWAQPEGSAGLGKPPEKIAAIGVKVDVKGISRHGFALNVNPDMSYWEGIIGCGLEGYSVTSLKTLLKSSPPMDQVMDAIVKAFMKLFEYQMVEKPLD